MWLTAIEADRLRNLQALRVGLEAGLTVVHGENGQGKSSLLEAIYLLATGRSFRTRVARDLVAWNGGPLRVAGSLSGQRGQVRLGVVLDGEARGLLVEGVERDLESYLGRMDVIDLTAERMKVLRGAPVDRRRFLDRGVAGLRPSYLRAIRDYRRAIQHRNALLRRRGRATGSLVGELETWEGRIADAASVLHIERRRYAQALSAQLGEIGRAILPPGQTLSLDYRPSPAAAAGADPAAFAGLLREHLEQSREHDLERGLTSRGPHRDDLVVGLGGVDLRRFGSAGQVRAAMVALKLAKLSVLREERADCPIFLMDDFDSDLDEARASAVAAFLREGGFQALVATSKVGLVRRLGLGFREVRMEGGSAGTV
jgi:DNA replication and repair protein RecF